VADFIKKVNLVFNESYRSKYRIIKHIDTKDESDDFSIEIKDITEPASVLPIIEPDSAECRYITLDTEPVYEVTKPEYNQSITKPEEAGGLCRLKSLHFYELHINLNIKSQNIFLFFLKNC